MNSEKQSTNLQMTLREVNRVGEGQKNVPKLRFKGYEDAWEQRKLGAAISVKSGKDYKHLDEGDVPVYGTGGYMLSVSEALENTRDAIGIGRKGTIDKPFVLKAPFWTVDTLFYCIPKENNSLSFLYSLFQSINWKLYDESTGVPSLSKTAIDGVTIKLTSEDEQSSIGECFESVDNLITLHQRKYDALKSLKKTLLSKMFPKNEEDVPEIRFKGFTDAWEQRKLGEVSQIVGGGTPSTGIPEYWDGDIDWYSPAEIGEEIFVSCSQRKITQLGLEKSSAKILPVGTVLFTSRAGIGDTAILEKEGCTNQGFQSIVPKANELDSYFIFSCSHLLKKYGETKGAGSTFVEISGKQMSLMPLNIPEIKEQKSVGNFFRKLDSIITLHQRKLDELKNMKKTLLQQMFV